MKNIFNKFSFNYFVIFFSIVLLFIYSTGQLTDVYIRHDDWEFMTYLLPNMSNHGTPWDKTLWEGRWVNYLWSFIARDLSVNANYILFILGYSLFSWVSSCVIATKISTRVLLAFAIFACPAYADLSFWPATLTPSVWLAAFLVGGYYATKNKIYLSLFFILLPMAYAPLLPVCFLLISFNHKNIKELCNLGIIYYSSYIIGVLIIYSLNYYFHNKFGVNIADWRNPNPIHSFQDFISNLTKLLLFWVEYFSKNIFEVLLSFILVIYMILIDKKKAICLVFSIIIVLIFDSSLYIYSGVDIPIRSVIWIWFVYILISALALTQNTYNKIVQYGAFLLIILILINGCKTWKGFYYYEVKHARFETNLSTLLKSQSRRDVFLCGDISKIQGDGKRSLRPITLSLWKREGIYLQSFSGEECNQLPNAIGVYDLNNKTFLKIF